MTRVAERLFWRILLLAPACYAEQLTVHVIDVKTATPVKEISVQLINLVVGLQHLGRNHISFVHSALEWAAAEDSWI